ncbi:MAG: hypothetical protein U0573_00405 [Phycisphaerales bacterium]|nr:hypothetical protein [Planctomycetota bacterium]
MPQNSTDARRARHLIAIRVGLLLVLVAGGAMMALNQYDALHGMGNPSPESQQRAREVTSIRNLALWVIIGASVVMICASVSKIIDLDKASRSNDVSRS